MSARRKQADPRAEDRRDATHDRAASGGAGGDEASRGATPHEAAAAARSASGSGSARVGVDAIHTELRDRISLLHYAPGEMLSENALAEEFGVSRTPVRQALQRLEFEGLVASRRGIGTMVTTVDLMYLREVFALRLKLIDVIGELSPGRITDADVALLRAVRDDVAALTDRRDPTTLARHYVRFNRELSRAIGNQPLREIADRLFYQTSRVWMQILRDLDWRTEVEAVIDEVDRVTEALRRGDMREVARVRREHMVAMLRRLNAYLGHVLPSEPATERHGTEGNDTDRNGPDRTGTDGNDTQRNGTERPVSASRAALPGTAADGEAKKETR